MMMAGGPKQSTSLEAKDRLARNLSLWRINVPEGLIP